MVQGYVLEHVPSADVQPLLAARPDALGLAVPGMLVGSPGMEMGGRVGRFEVLLVDRVGGATVFARYPRALAPLNHPLGRLPPRDRGLETRD